VKLTIPELSLVLLVGPSGCGKSTFARRFFRPTEIVSSDYFRGVVCDDESNQNASRDAFELLHQVVARRLHWKRLTVVDATNLQPDARKTLWELARKYHYLTAAIVFDIGEDQCRRYNLLRPERTTPDRVITSQSQLLRKALRSLESEKVTRLCVLDSLEQVANLTIERVPLWVDRRNEVGPFDIIGDVHGCLDELLDLLVQLGYHVGFQTDLGGNLCPVAVPPPGRRAIFVGDLGDRGPNTPGVYRLVMNMVQNRQALCIMGNHDSKLKRKLDGNQVTLTHGLAETMEQLAREPQELSERIAQFLDDLVSHYVLDQGRLVVAHAGLREDLQGRASGKVRAFALFGDTTGETDELGLPVRLNWAAEYRGPALVVYGHTPTLEPLWQNNTVNIDTGCVFGGKLTALRYPEREIVSVGARATYAEAKRAFLSVETDTRTAQQDSDDILDLADVTGKLVIPTRLMNQIIIPAANSSAALEVMSRFAANPRWLIYLPPTMSPPETSKLPGTLEHPAEAFNYFRNQKVTRVICEEKHMGSRAIVVLCKDEAAALRAFGVENEGVGVILTRTGRRFFDGDAIEVQLLDRLREAITEAKLWHEFSTDWFCIDAELLPWSAKAGELLRNQYAAVGSAALAALGGALHVSQEFPEIHDRYRQRLEAAQRFVTAYRQYCRNVDGVKDLRLAPFHLLASRGAVHVDKAHPWHMEQLARLARVDGELILATDHREVEVEDTESVRRAIEWWETLTAQGGEGMVVKPIDFVARGTKGLIQPAIKCRGREYLRIIYGPEYTFEENLERLRNRGVGGKRSLALREFALGVEGLERFVRGEPLRRVHECVFGVLALESEPIDPRL
jgi:protein phosphatase